MKVYSPVRDYNGNYGVDVFVNGCCQNASEHHREYYERAGYTVTDDDGAPPPVVTPAVPVETPAPVEDVGVSASAPPPRSATTAEWREFAAAVGLDVPAGAKRSEIISLYDASKSEQ